jgi:Phosphate-selective porin O and P
MRRTVLLALLAGLPVAVANGQNLDPARAANAQWLSANVAQSSSLQAANPVTVSGFTQIRFNYNSRDSVPIVGAEDTTQGFSNAETRIEFGGTVGEMAYLVSGSFDSMGTFQLVDAYVAHGYDNGWTVVAGQQKAPYTREALISDSGVMAAGRSVVDSAFSAMRVQGLAGLKTAENYRFWVAVSDGVRTSNTDFTSGGEADIAFTSRFEYMWQGTDWSVFDDFASFQGSDMSAMAGAAVHYQMGGDTFAAGTGVTTDVDVLGLTGDVTIEGNGWAAFGSVVYQSNDFAAGSGTDSDDLGYVAQGSYFVDPFWEIFARFDSISADVAEDFSTVTFGVNKYFIEGSQAAKFTVDVQLFLDEQMPSLAPASSNNVLLSSGSDSQYGIRGQLQLVF